VPLQLPQITEGPPKSGLRHLAADCKADTSIRHLHPIRDSPDTQFRPVKMVEGAPAHGAVAHLLPLTYKRYVSEWLEEDTPSFDYGGFVVGEEMSEAKLLGKSAVGSLCNPPIKPDSARAL
jgi:hypothetical protein